MKTFFARRATTVCGKAAIIPRCWGRSSSICSPASTVSVIGWRVGFLVITRFRLLYDDWRGYLVALFALVYVSNFYMGLFGRVKLEVRKGRAEIKAIEAEVQAKKKGSGRAA